MVQFYISLLLSGKVCQLQHPPVPQFVPVKAAVVPPAAQNGPPLGGPVKAKAVDGSQTATTVNPFRKAAKGMESGAILYPNY